MVPEDFFFLGGARRDVGEAEVLLDHDTDFRQVGRRFGRTGPSLELADRVENFDFGLVFEGTVVRGSNSCKLDFALDFALEISFGSRFPDPNPNVLNKRKAIVHVPREGVFLATNGDIVRV